MNSFGDSVSLIPAASIRNLFKTKEEKHREACLSVIENSRIFHFFGVTDITPEKIDTVVSDVLSIRDDQKILLTALLLDRWFCSRTTNSAEMYCKHVQSGTKNILYQVILGNGIWDGVYEFGLKGIDISAKGTFDKEGYPTLEISSPGNYDAVTVRGADGGEISLTRADLGDAFEDRLLAMGLVTETELGTYSGRDRLTSQYLRRTLPGIVIG